MFPLIVHDRGPMDDRLGRFRVDDGESEQHVLLNCGTAPSWIDTLAHA